MCYEKQILLRIKKLNHSEPARLIPTPFFSVSKIASKIMANGKRIGETKRGKVKRNGQLKNEVH